MNAHACNREKCYIKDVLKTPFGTTKLAVREFGSDAFPIIPSFLSFGVGPSSERDKRILLSSSLLYTMRMRVYGACFAGTPCLGNQRM